TLVWVSVRGRQYQRRECTMSTVGLRTSVCVTSDFTVTRSIRLDLTKCGLVLNTYFCSTRLSS
ncbi:hypothetical protein IscW_ISCW014924, partial [Ixodes scapularis]